jgi:hypothetical protein
VVVTKYKSPSMTTQQAIELILMEYERACKKFPYWPDDKIHAAAIVNEEAGELIRAALRAKYEGGEWGEMEEEAIQAGAMCIRFLVNL